MVVLGIESSLLEINSCRTTKRKHAICQKPMGLDAHGVWLAADAVHCQQQKSTL